eukprot:scaffold86062_cov18-Tisochrysis_lutea.AAC.2
MGGLLAVVCRCKQRRLQGPRIYGIWQTTQVHDHATHVSYVLLSSIASSESHVFQCAPQVERVRQTLERQYSDPTWLAQRARRQHKRELVLAGLELGQMKEGEVGGKFS